jgi:hypothetical protein
MPTLDETVFMVLVVGAVFVATRLGWLGDRLGRLFARKQR